MDEMLRHLKSALEAEEKAYVQLLALSERQQSALIERRTEDLLDVAAQQEKILLLISRLNVAGSDALERVAEKLDLPTPLTLSELILELPQQQANSLREIQSSLHAIAEQLGQTNRINKELLDCGLDTIGYTFRLLAQSSQDAAPAYPQQTSSPSPVALKLNLRV
jgi:hypothetical protein